MIAPISVLLDLDGTLVDSQQGIVASCHAALMGLGHAPDPAQDLRRYIGPPMDDMMRDILAHYGDDRVSEGVTAYRAHYGSVGLFGSTVYPGIEAALDALIAAGARLFLATSKRTMFARTILDHLGLGDRLTGLYGSEPGGAVDEKPALIAHVLEREGLAAERSVMVGDRRFDIIGARANRMRSIGVLWGYGDRDELNAAGADRLIEQPAALPAAVATLLG